MKLKGWKEITPGAVITEAGSAQKFKTGSWRAFRPQWLEENCIQCLFCWLYCPDMAIKVQEGKRAEFDYDYCKGCGICAYAAADIAKVNDPNAPASSIELGTGLSGFSNTTTDVTPTGGVVSLETHYVPPTSGIYVQFPLGREPEVPIAYYARVRVTAGASVNAYAGLMWDE